MATANVVPLQFKPKINPDDHGTKVVLCGALLYGPLALMVVVSLSNRIRAKTFFGVDNIITIAGIVLSAATYATFVKAVHDGFGKHTRVLSEAQQGVIQRDILSAILLFFIAQALIKVAYNLLARKTARSQRFIKAMDVFSGVIALWSIANIIVMSMSIAKQAAPKRAFFIASGLLTLGILLGQLASFLWIIWSTAAYLPVKIRWSISIGLFVPACVTAIIYRLVLTPANMRTGDWTFTLINSAMVFLIELDLSIMNLLAPSLPMFFDKTSTGGLHFVPGDTMQTGKGTSSGGPSQFASKQGKNSQLRSRVREGRSMYEDEPIQLSKMDGMFATTVRRDRDQEDERASFGSDKILVRQSFEVTA